MCEDSLELFSSWNSNIKYLAQQGRQILSYFNPAFSMLSLCKDSQREYHCNLGLMHQAHECKELFFNPRYMTAYQN